MWQFYKENFTGIPILKFMFMQMAIKIKKEKNINKYSINIIY